MVEREPQPAPEQLAAVREAERRVAAAFAPIPAFRVTWSSGDMRSLDGRHPVNACVLIGPDSLICLPVTASPTALLRSMTHELVHVVHADRVPHASRETRERIAETVTAQLVPEVSRTAP